MSRAWALQLLLDAPSGGHARTARRARVGARARPLARLVLGRRRPEVRSLNISGDRSTGPADDPDGLRRAARAVASRAASSRRDARRLLAILKRHDPIDPPGRLSSDRLLRGRPDALVEAVEILISRPRDVATVLLRNGYTDEALIDGFLDRGL